MIRLFYLLLATLPTLAWGEQQPQMRVELIVESFDAKSIVAKVPSGSRIKLPRKAIAKPIADGKRHVYHVAVEHWDGIEAN